MLGFSPYLSVNLPSRVYSLSREAVQQVVEFTQSLLNQGKSVAQVMEVLMPA
jgi:hypothetical protein